MAWGRSACCRIRWLWCLLRSDILHSLHCLGNQGLVPEPLLILSHDTVPILALLTVIFIRLLPHRKSWWTRKTPHFYVSWNFTFSEVSIRASHKNHNFPTLFPFQVWEQSPQPSQKTAALPYPKVFSNATESWDKAKVPCLAAAKKKTKRWRSHGIFRFYVVSWWFFMRHSWIWWAKNDHFFLNHH